MEIPSCWLEVFKTVQSVEPSAILAGGALRDLDNERPVKDLDIFVPVDSLNPPRIVEALSKTHQLESWLGDQYFDWDTCVANVGVINAVVEGLPPVNLIVIHDCTIANQMERFDFGICRIMFNGNTLHRHPGYVKDKEDHTFTLLRNCTYEQRVYSRKRFERLQEKYPGWTLVIPVREAQIVAADLIDFDDLLK